MVWPQRLKERCRHFKEHFNGKEIYEMWLRTSAGKGLKIVSYSVKLEQWGSEYRTFKI